MPTPEIPAAHQSAVPAAPADRGPRAPATADFDRVLEGARTRDQAKASVPARHQERATGRTRIEMDVTDDQLAQPRPVSPRGAVLRLGAPSHSALSDEPDTERIDMETSSATTDPGDWAALAFARISIPFELERRAGTPPAEVGPDRMILEAAQPSSGDDKSSATMLSRLQSGIRGAGVDSELGVDRALPEFKILDEETHFKPIHHDAVRHPELNSSGADEATVHGANPGGPNSALAAEKSATLDQIHAVADADSRVGPELMVNEVAVGSVASQILDAIRSAVVQNRSAVSDPPGVSTSSQRPDGMIRFLRLQLAPQSLGLVNVVVLGSGTSLRIRLEVENGEAARALDADRTSLESRLTELGTVIEDISVTRLMPPETRVLELSPPSSGAAVTSPRLGESPDHGGGGRRWHSPPNGNRNRDSDTGGEPRGAPTSVNASEPPAWRPHRRTLGSL